MDPDQTAQMRRLVWIHAGRRPIMLVLSWRGSYAFFIKQLPTGTVDDIFGDEEEVVSVQDAAGGDNEEDPIISVTTAPASYHDDSDDDLLA
jgi:hypothetical protein